MAKRERVRHKISFRVQESLRKYSVVPVVVRRLMADDELCGYTVPRGTFVICHLQSVHHLWKDALAWQPERFMPDGEYDQFEESIRPYMVRSSTARAAIAATAQGSHMFSGCEHMQMCNFGTTYDSITVCMSKAVVQRLLPFASM